MAKKSFGKQPYSTQPMLEKHGETLVEKVVAAEGAGAAAAAANLYRTLVEWTIPKPEQKVDISGFKGDVRIVVEGVD